MAKSQIGFLAFLLKFINPKLEKVEVSNEYMDILAFLSISLNFWFGYFNMILKLEFIHVSLE
jgi:hypothetical protein